MARDMVKRNAWIKEYRQKPHRKEDQRIRALKHYERNQNILYQIRAESVCDCGMSDHRCMMLHHVDPDEKIYSMGSYTRKSVEMLVREIEKCKIMCANCHTILHVENKTLSNGRR